MDNPDIQVLVVAGHVFANRSVFWFYSFLNWVGSNFLCGFGLLGCDEMVFFYIELTWSTQKEHFSDGEMIWSSQVLCGTENLQYKTTTTRRPLPGNWAIYKLHHNCNLAYKIDNVKCIHFRVYYYLFEFCPVFVHLWRLAYLISHHLTLVQTFGPRKLKSWLKRGFFYDVKSTYNWVFPHSHQKRPRDNKGPSIFHSGDLASLLVTRLTITY